MRLVMWLLLMVLEMRWCHKALSFWQTVRVATSTPYDKLTTGAFVSDAVTNADDDLS